MNNKGPDSCSGKFLFQTILFGVGLLMFGGVVVWEKNTAFSLWVRILLGVPELFRVSDECPFSGRIFETSLYPKIPKMMICVKPFLEETLVYSKPRSSLCLPRSLFR